VLPLVLAIGIILSTGLLLIFLPEMFDNNQNIPLVLFVQKRNGWLEMIRNSEWLWKNRTDVKKADIDINKTLKWIYGINFVFGKWTEMYWSMYVPDSQKFLIATWLIMNSVEGLICFALLNRYD
jgi:polyferredoxin